MATTSTSTIYEHMFRSFGLKENPFPVSPDPRFLFSGAAYESALAELMFGIESHRGLLVLTGEAGTGKTTLMRHFLQWLEKRQFSSSYIFHTHLDPADLFEFVLRDFGVPVESHKKSDLLATLHRWLHSRQAEGDSPVIVVDEAQALSLRTLSELNLLLNLENTRGKLVQIVLCGQPELEEKLRRPESRALRQRIMVRCRLPLLSLEETQEYIASRLRGAGGSGTETFPLETVQTIYSYARGIPRVVNLLCEQSLIGAYADRQLAVSPQNVRKAAMEFDMAGAPFAASQFDVAFAPKTRTAAAPSEVPAASVPPAINEAPTAQENVTDREVPEIQETPVAVQATAVSVQPVSVESAPVVGPVSVSRMQDMPPTMPLATEIPTEQVPVTSQGSEAAPASAEQVPAGAAESPIRGSGQVRTAPSADEPEFAEVALAREVKAPEQRRPRSEGELPKRAYAWRKHRTASPFQIYWREVAESFVRDWRRFFASLAPQIATFPRTTLPSTDSIRRSVIELRHWLIKPMGTRSTRATPRQRSQKF